MKKFLLLFGWFLLIEVQGQRLAKRSCPERPVVKHFDVAKYAGRWFEIYRYEQPWTVGCLCTNVHFIPTADKIAVKNCCHRDGNFNCLEGSAVVSYPNQEPLEGKLNVTFFGPPTQSNYWVFDTDYTHYAIVYLCEDIPLTVPMSKESFWVLSRFQDLSDDSRAKVEAIIDEHFDRSTSVFYKTEHLESCNYE